MVSMKQIRAMGRRIGREFHPDRVLLFGSYARGDQGADSDVDLLVIMPTEGKAVYQAAKIRASLRTDFPVDIVVRTPDQVCQRLALEDFFMKEALEQGKVLYETPSR
jgi:predicted nucleotidyltransferase